MKFLHSNCRFKLSLSSESAAPSRCTTPTKTSASPVPPATATTYTLWREKKSVTEETNVSFSD